MLYIFQSWKESLAIFIPKNFKLFLLVTLRSTMDLFGNLIYLFWWLMLATFIFLVGGHYPAWAHAGLIWHVIGDILMMILIFVGFMLARPSILPKGSLYFKKNIRRTAAGFIGLYALCNIILRPMLVWLPIQMVIRPLLEGSFPNPFYLYMIFRLDFMPCMIFPPFACAVLFYLDSDGGLRSWFLSIVRGCMMYLYNLPFCLLSMFSVFVVWFGLAMISSTLAWSILWLFVPFVLSYFKNMYVKRLHDQFNLYFANE